MPPPSIVRAVTALRYVTPLREGGSMPGLVEADDDGLYVVKLRGAGQGPPVLVAELLSAELARLAGLEVPEVVTVELDPALGRNEPDPEVRDLILASTGVNLGLDFLPGSVTYDPAADPPPDPLLASKIVLFDAFITNPDRTPKNPNILTWQRRPWLIDHGAALYFQYAWSPDAPLAGARTPFGRIRDHVLLAHASRLADAAVALGGAWSAAGIARITSALPDSWLTSDHATLPSREQYAAWLETRLEVLPHLAEECARVRASVV